MPEGRVSSPRVSGGDLINDVAIIDAGGVNCYLLRTMDGFVLIDSGLAGRRARLRRELEHLGCAPGKLRLVVLTHADPDHAGSCRFFQQEYGAKIAVHQLESEAVRRGNMLLSRRSPTLVVRLVGTILRFGGFQPDLHVVDGQSLTGFGLDATILHLPGHSVGSIGVLTAAGDLFCGDLLANRGKPAVNSPIDDRPAAEDSLTRLRSLAVKTVHPGHGQSFPVELLA